MLESFKEIQNRVENYRSQMLVIAHQYDRQTWIADHNHDPYSQLDSDLRRLNELLSSLKQAVEERGAKNLREACEQLRLENSETAATLEYVLQSDYEEFRKIREAIEG